MTDGAETRPESMLRLSININAATATALRELAARRNVSVTEVVRRAVAISKLVEDEAAAGHVIQILDGKTVRELVLLDTATQMCATLGHEIVPAATSGTLYAGGETVRTAYCAECARVPDFVPDNEQQPGEATDDPRAGLPLRTVW